MVPTVWPKPELPYCSPPKERMTQQKRTAEDKGSVGNVCFVSKLSEDIRLRQTGRLHKSRLQRPH